MVVAFLALTLVPACFLFAFSYGLLNRSIDKWFGIPFDVVHSDATEVVRQLAIQAENRSRHLARPPDHEPAASRGRLAGRPVRPSTAFCSAKWPI